MILAYDGSSLAHGLSGVGYYTRRLLDELAARALRGTLTAPVVLSNKPVPVPAGARLHEAHRFPAYTSPPRLGLPGSTYAASAVAVRDCR